MEFIRQKDGTLVGVGCAGVRFIIREMNFEGRTFYDIRTENDAPYRKVCRLWGLNDGKTEEEAIAWANYYNRRIQETDTLSRLGLMMCLDNGKVVPYVQLDPGFENEDEEEGWDEEEDYVGAVFMVVPDREALRTVRENEICGHFPNPDTIKQEGPYLLHYIPYEGYERWQLIPSGMVDFLKQHLE